jgi:hypothetical protein
MLQNVVTKASIPAGAGRNAEKRRVCVFLPPAFVSPRWANRICQRFCQLQDMVLKCRMSAAQQLMYQHLKQHGILLTDRGCVDVARGVEPREKKLRRRLQEMIRICIHPCLIDEVCDVKFP